MKLNLLLNGGVMLVSMGLMFLNLLSPQVGVFCLLISMVGIVFGAHLSDWGSKF